MPKHELDSNTTMTRKDDAVLDERSAPNPENVRAPSSAADSEFCEQVLGAFQGSFPRVRRSFLYRFAMMLVAVVTILLPIVYLMMIAGVGWLVYYHVTHHHGMLTWGYGIRGRALIMIAYAAPVVVGAILIFFMTKPIFARPARQPRIRSLTADGEPLLFKLVERICDAVHAPRPSRIDVDARLNMSAGFRGGMISMIGSDLVLTIGMPLAAGLTIKQFVGALGHEFGHFSQGLGMRLAYIIRSINLWFARVVYQRDEWDVWLTEAMEENDFRIGWIFGLAQLCVVLTRGLLWCLMMCSHAISGAFLRQMEYDADRYQARLVGNDTLEATMRRIQELDEANQAVFAQLRSLCARGVLPDNLPDLTITAASELAGLAASRKSTKEKYKQERPSTSIFDTHPSDVARIANVKRRDNKGVFSFEGNARDLFRHFDAIAQGTTWDFYCATISSNIRPTDLRPINEILHPVATPNSGTHQLDEETIPFD
jgi:Zn-dependent protease with chaperone function